MPAGAVEASLAVIATRSFCKTIGLKAPEGTIGYLSANLSSQNLPCHYRLIGNGTADSAFA